MKNLFSLIIAGIAMALISGIVPAGAADPPPINSSLSKQDNGFVKAAAQAGMAEVQASKIALQKSQDIAVRSFAQRMVDDHTKADDKLKELARTQSLTLPPKPSKPQQKKIDSLHKVSGKNFNQRYVDFFGVPAHEEAVHLFEREVQSGKDSALRDFAQETLSTLREHLEMARDLRAHVHAG